MLCAQRRLTLWPYALCSSLGSSVRGIFQAWILEGVPISYSTGSSWARDWTHKSFISCIGRWILYYCATWPHPKEEGDFFFVKIFWVFIEFVTTLLLFYVFLVFWPRGMWDLISLTRERTHTLFSLEGRVLTTGLSGKFQDNFVVIKIATVDTDQRHRESGCISPEITLWLSLALGNQWPGLPSFLRFL